MPGVDGPFTWAATDKDYDELRQKKRYQHILTAAEPRDFVGCAL